MIDSLGISLILSDFIGGKSGWVIDLADQRKEFCKRDDDGGSKYPFNMLDITIFGHIVSNCQESISFLCNYLEGLHHIVSCVLIKVLFVKKFYQFD